MPADPPQSCVHCGRALPQDLTIEICPACNRALSSPFEATDRTELEDELRSDPSTTLIKELVAALPDREPIRPLGAGGMGQVYLVRHKILERSEALKILQSKIAASERFRRRFRRESKVLAQLRHPNIVSIFDCTETNGFLCVLMEYVDGGTLRTLIKSPDVSLDRRVAIVTQVAEAMSYAHEHGVIHRDIKPENILLSQDGKVKVADFGIGKILNEENSEKELSTQGAMGTPGYMAPEQRETPNSVDRRSDVFSLGVLAYELLTGKVPQGAFERPSALVPVPQGVDAVIECALSHDINGRYPDGKAFLNAWRESTGRAKRWASPMGPSTSIWQSEAQDKLARTKGIVATICVLAVIGVLVQQLKHSTHSNQPIHEASSQEGGRLFPKSEALHEGESFELPGLGIRMLWVKAGSFELGQNNEVEWDSFPPIPVAITDGFWMAQHEVTQSQFQSLMSFNPSKFNREYFSAKSPRQGASNWQNRPVDSVSWQQAHDFCETLTQQAHEFGAIPEDYLFRLPSEVEWEYVCRAGGKPIYLPGQNLAPIIAQAVTVNTSLGTPETQVIGTREPNPWGFYDMLGNVAEFCLDRFWIYQEFADQSLTNWISNENCGIDRIFRGGHYLFDAAVVTSTIRGATCISDTADATGLRLVLSKNSPQINAVYAAVEPNPIEIETLNATFNWITPGQFTMGEPTKDSARGNSVFPPTEVQIDPGFWIGDTEVTEFQYQSIMAGVTELNVALDATADSQKKKALPVTNITWDEAVVYCDRLTELLRRVGTLPSGYVARLPTEAEWEWTCRRCAKGIYHWGPRVGPIFGSKVRYVQNSAGTPGPVKEKWSAPGCISGMYGNVKEWCLDWKYDYTGTSTVNPIGALRPAEELKSVRGGDFLSPSELCTGTARTFLPGSSKSPRVGFRVVIGSSSLGGRLDEPALE